MERPANAVNGQRLLGRSDSEKYFRSGVPDYALVFFDHLHSEYLALRSQINDEQAIKLFDSLHEKREKGELTWSDIYTFDLALIDWRPLENLVRKAYDARSKYRSIAGQKEYDEYLASKPPDLTAILIKPSALKLQPAPDEEFVTSAAKPAPDFQLPTSDANGDADIPDSAEIVQRILRADIRYLLSKFYLYYAMLPIREGVREQLTRRAVKMTLIILGLIILFALMSLGGLKIFNSDKFKQIFDVTGVFGITVLSVACAGIIGGCVSMLQRIQSAPTEGDALFNLAALTNGWRGLSLSPLYGAIFASLLFVLFAAGILEGSVFPKIETAGSKVEQTTSGAQPAATPPPAGIFQAEEFLKQTGPKDGVSFALLMIWSFIAGFAERLVPDTLNRLVTKTEAIQGTNG